MEYYKKVKGYRDDMTRGRTAQFNAELLQSTEIAASQRRRNAGMDRTKKMESTVEKFWNEQVREVIEEQLLKREKESHYEDDIWGLHLDVMANFNGYFSRDNPKYLQEKFSW
jgi:hypothetical protein